MTTASLLRRASALVIDALCALLPLLLVAPLLVAFWGGSSGSRFVALFILTLNAGLSVLLYLLLQMVQLARDQATPGRRLLRLRVVDRDGAAPALWRVLVRVGSTSVLLAFCLASGLYPLLLLAPLAALVDRDWRALPDILAGTQVQMETDTPLPPTATAVERE